MFLASIFLQGNCIFPPGKFGYIYFTKDYVISHPSFEEKRQKKLAGTWQEKGKYLVWKIEENIDKLLYTDKI
jgi:hypothetical protein